MRVLRKLIACYIILYVVVVSTVVIPVKQAEAAIALAPAAYPAVAGLLTAAGITFMTDEGARAGAIQAWESFSDGLKTKILNAVAIGSVTIGLTTMDWDELLAGAGKVTDGVVTGVVNPQGYTWDLAPGQDYVEYINPGPGRIAVEANVQFGKYGSINDYQVEFTGTYNYVGVRISEGYVGGRKMYYPRIAYYMNGESSTVYLREYASESKIIPTYIEITADGEYIHVYFRGTHVITFASAEYIECIKAFNSSDSEHNYTGTYTMDIVTTVEQVAGVTYYVTDYYGNPAWDLGNREVPVVVSIPEILGKTAEDVMAGAGSGVINPPGIGEELGTVTGWLSNIYHKLTTIGASVGAIANTLTGDIVGDISNIQIHKLQGIGGAITTKFPFSLPWDVKYLLENLNFTDEIPTWEVGLPNPITGGVAVIEFTIPEQFRYIINGIRTGITILFVAGLIYSTRKLLGGAT